jgi:hypothetical protein
MTLQEVVSDDLLFALRVYHLTKFESDESPNLFSNKRMFCR